MSNNNIQNIGISLSYLIHPMIISFVTFFYLIYYSNILIEDKNLVFIICTIFSTILPTFTFYILKKNNLISDLDASNKEERLLPMAFGSLFFLLGFIFLRNINVQMIIQGTMFCGMINVMLAWLITKHWKISIHAITISSSITIFWIFGYQNVLIIVFVLFILIVSRLLARAHDITQIMAGIFLGIISTFSCFTSLFLQK